MKNLPLITFIIGTRPEAIKLSPVILKFKECKLISTRIILTGQHKEMTYQVMKLFNLKEDINLEIMKKQQSLTHITSSVIVGLEEELIKNKPEILFVQGDTTTAFAAALAGFYKKILVAHIEAGLRTGDINNPYPEEVNRKLISQISSLNFAPTKAALKNLEKENVLGKIVVTGNTCIDALKLLEEKSTDLSFSKKIKWSNQKVILVTVHRRENWGENLTNIAEGLKKLVDNNESISILLPMHRNSYIRENLKMYLDNHSRIELIEPLNYLNFITAMKHSYIILTDSGGLQEEAPSFKVPVLILRETTERKESIKIGCAKLIGTQPNNIKNEVELLLNNRDIYESMVCKSNPYGDGNASNRILNTCLKEINLIKNL